MEELIKKLSELRTMFMQLAIALRETNPGKSYANFDHSQICERAVNELARNKPQKIDTANPPAWLYGRNWNLINLTARGTDVQNEQFTYESTSRGVVLRLQ